MAIPMSHVTSAPFRQRGIEVAAYALLGLLITLAGCASAPPLAQQPPAGMSASVPAPAISTGDSWTYRVRDGFTGLPRSDQRHEVTRAAAGRIEVAGNVERGDGSQVYDAEWNWLRRPATDLQTFEYSPAYQAYAFPLAPGKTWRSESMATDPRDGRRFPVKIEAKVLGWERVKVPAGEFDALKIQRIVTIGYWESMTRGTSYIKEYRLVRAVGKVGGQARSRGHVLQLHRHARGR